MGLLHDDFALHACKVREINDLFPVRAREHGGRAQRQRRRGPGGHHGGFTSEQRRDPLTDTIVQLVQHHVVFGGVFDRIHHLWRHERSGHARVGPRGVDEWSHAELFEVLATLFSNWRRLRSDCAPTDEACQR
jgi:hypothetical protein